MLCTVAAGSCGVFGSNFIKSKKENSYERIIKIARKEIGVREATNKNDGTRVGQYLNYVGFKEGAPWCAAWVSFCFGQAGYKMPRTAWSPALFPASRLAKQPMPAFVFGIWSPNLHRVAHVGFVERLQGDFVQTMEGNTSPGGSREGHGVYRCFRHKKTIYSYANWLAERKKD